MARVADQNREAHGQEAIARADIGHDARGMKVHCGEDIVDVLPLLSLGFVSDVLSGDGERDE